MSEFVCDRFQSAHRQRDRLEVDFTGWPKMAQFLYALTLPNVNQFKKKYFTVGIRRKFAIILLLKIQSHLKCFATRPCEMSSILKATLENGPPCIAFDGR